MDRVISRCFLVVLWIHNMEWSSQYQDLKHGFHICRGWLKSYATYQGKKYMKNDIIAILFLYLRLLIRIHISLSPFYCSHIRICIATSCYYPNFSICTKCFFYWAPKAIVSSSTHTSLVHPFICISIHLYLFTQLFHNLVFFVRFTVLYYLKTIQGENMRHFISLLCNTKASISTWSSFDIYKTSRTIKMTYAS